MTIKELRSALKGIKGVEEFRIKQHKQGTTYNLFTPKSIKWDDKLKMVILKLIKTKNNDGIYFGSRQQN